MELENYTRGTPKNRLYTNVAEQVALLRNVRAQDGNRSFPSHPDKYHERSSISKEPQCVVQE